MKFLAYVFSILHGLMFAAMIFIALHIPDLTPNVRSSIDGDPGPSDSVGFGILMCIGTVISWFFTAVYCNEDTTDEAKTFASGLHTILLGGMAIALYYWLPLAIVEFMKVQ